MTDLDRALADLFRGPPGAFTAGRDRLAKELRSEGRTEDAAAVKALRRPTTAAWALNQVALRSAGELEALLDVGARLREVQANLGRGGAAELRRVGDERRRLIGALTAEAARLVVDEGVARVAPRDEIAAGLAAAVADPEAAEQLRRGRLAQPPPPPSGFGVLAALEPPEPAAGDADRARSGRASEPPPHDLPVEEERPPDPREVARRRKALRDARQRVRDAEKEVRAAERALLEARRSVTDAEQAVERRRVAQHEAEEALEALERDEG